MGKHQFRLEAEKYVVQNKLPSSEHEKLAKIVNEQVRDNALLLTYFAASWGLEAKPFPGWKETYVHLATGFYWCIIKYPASCRFPLRLSKLDHHQSVRSTHVDPSNSQGTGSFHKRFSSSLRLATEFLARRLENIESND